MTRRTRAWRSDDTRRALAQAAWRSLHAGQERGELGLDIADVLTRADQLWDEEFPNLARPAFTRGAITANFQTVGNLQAAALRLAFGAEQAVVPKLFHDLDRDLDYAASAGNRAERRLRTEAAICDYVVQDLIRISTDPASLRLYLDMLSRSLEPALREATQEIYDGFQARMTRALSYSARITEYKFDVEECARILTALIEGAAMRIVFDSTVSHSFVVQIGISAAKLPAQMSK